MESHPSGFLLSEQYIDRSRSLVCLDAATGANVWKHETNEAIWGCLLLAGERLYVGNVEGSLTVLRAGRRKAIAGADRDGCAALFAAGADRRYALSGHREPVVPHLGIFFFWPRCNREATFSAIRSASASL